MVVNLDEKNEPGSHWVAIYIPDPSTARYFDSYGEEIIPNIKNYLKKCGIKHFQRQIFNVK
jgi:hypothetical protein